jgi:hypothetical protein
MLCAFFQVVRKSLVPRVFSSPSVCRFSDHTKNTENRHEARQGGLGGRGTAFGVAGCRRGPDCLVWGRGGGPEAAGDMGDADPGGGQGVYHHPKHLVDDRSISAPPVLELTAKVIATACRL